MRQGRRRAGSPYQFLTPPAWPRESEARAPRLSGGERGACPGAEVTQPGSGSAVATSGSQAASAPNPQPRQRASELSMTKQTRAGFLLCNPVRSKSASEPRWPAAGNPGAGTGRLPAGQSPSPGGAASRAAPGAHGPRRAGVLTLRSPVTSRLPDPQNKLGARPCSQKRPFPKFLPLGT